MTTTLLLIRHGQTNWNVLGRWQGHEDIPLNETGRQQAQMLAQRLSTWPITAVYSSNLKRAAETARILADALSLVAVIDTVWRERHCGVFQGLTMDEIQRRHPAAWDEIVNGKVNPPGGESMMELHERVSTSFNELLKRHPGETVAVVSHGGTLRMLIGHVLGLPRELAPPVRLNGNTGISTVEIQKGKRPHLSRLNDTAHLEMATVNK